MLLNGLSFEVMAGGRCDAQSRSSPRAGFASPTHNHKNPHRYFKIERRGWGGVGKSERFELARLLLLVGSYVLVIVGPPTPQPLGLSLPIFCIIFVDLTIFDEVLLI